MCYEPKRKSKIGKVSFVCKTQLLLCFNQFLGRSSKKWNIRKSCFENCLLGGTPIKRKGISCNINWNFIKSLKNGWNKEMINTLTISCDLTLGWVSRVSTITTMDIIRTNKCCVIGLLDMVHSGASSS